LLIFFKIVADKRFAIVEWQGERKFSVVAMADFEKIENEYELEKIYKVRWSSGQKFQAKLVLIGF